MHMYVHVCACVTTCMSGLRHLHGRHESTVCCVRRLMYLFGRHHALMLRSSFKRGTDPKMLSDASFQAFPPLRSVRWFIKGVHWSAP